MKERGLFGRVLGALAASALLAALAGCGPRMGGPAPLVMGASPWGASPWPAARIAGVPAPRPAPFAGPIREGVSAPSPVVVAGLPPRAEEVLAAPLRSEYAAPKEAAAAPQPRQTPPVPKPTVRPPVRVAVAAPRQPSGPAAGNHRSTPPRAVPAAAAPPPTAAAASPAQGAGFLWPVRGRVIAGFGPGPDGTHNDGINIAAPRGAPVEAIAAGVVIYAGNELRGYGNLILIKHPEGWISAYAHLDVILVRRAERVSRGQVIGRVGSTGSVRTPQLHFELRRADRAVNPLKFLAPRSTAATSSPQSRG